MKFGTKAIHGGLEPDPATGSVMTPIYQTSTYAQEAVKVNKGYEYSRAKNPTRTAFEQNLAAIENAKFGAAFGSGLAAVDCLMKLLNPGDEVISSVDLYGGTYRVFNGFFAKYGIKFHHVDMDYPDQVLEKLNEKTKMVWLESPTNPTLKIVDINAMAELVKPSGAIVVVDNTFATPFLQNPLDLGAHVVMHSVTKYIGGHSDLVLGALLTNDEELASKIYEIQNGTGAICGPQDCFLAIRGIKTLHVRMERHCQNAASLAQYLEGHPAVAGVNYPGLKSFKGHEVAQKQMRDFGGMLSFSLKNDTVKAAHDLLAKTKVITLAESLGGVESLIGHPATMTHTAVPEEVRKATGIYDSLIRLSVGIEDIDDLLEDLEFALK